MGLKIVDQRIVARQQQVVQTRSEGIFLNSTLVSVRDRHEILRVHITTNHLRWCCRARFLACTGMFSDAWISVPMHGVPLTIFDQGQNKLFDLCEIRCFVGTHVVQNLP